MPDPTFQNLGFELAGAAPGLAAGWTLAFQASVEEIAGYAPVPERPQEDYERGWLGNESFLFAFAPADLSAAPTETFEADWRSGEPLGRCHGCRCHARQDRARRDCQRPRSRLWRA